jgi:ABC-2 type transport system permease protein
VNRQLAAEVLKIRTVRSGYWLVLSMAVLVALPVISVLASDAAETLAELGEQRQIIRIAATADVFALLLGIVLIGGELRHGTITQTFLVEPVRERVLAAKAVLGAVLGCALALTAVGLVLVIAIPWLAGNGIDLELGDGELQRVILGIVLAGVLAGALGVGWGALFRGQGSAVAAALIWLLIGENVLRVALGEHREYSPGSAFAAVVSGSRSASADDDVLGMWPGTALALAYTLAFLVAGTLVLSRRDV